MSCLAATDEVYVSQRVEKSSLFSSDFRNEKIELSKKYPISHIKLRENRENEVNTTAHAAPKAVKTCESKW